MGQLELQELLYNFGYADPFDWQVPRISFFKGGHLVEGPESNSKFHWYFLLSVHRRFLETEAYAMCC